MAIMIKAIGDRFAEATAEYLHQKIRTTSTGIDETNLSNDDLIKEKYKGIRPAPGYPACPDHSEKKIIWDALGVEKELGLQLTESCAINPPSSISGMYFLHPESKYFMLGKISEDQINDYADRKNISKKEAEKWLAPNLAYDPKKLINKSETFMEYILKVSMPEENNLSVNETLMFIFFLN